MKYKLNKSYIIVLSVVFFGLVFFTSSLVKKMSSKETATNQQKLPECILGLCPVYQSVSVDGDDNDSESLVIIPTAMTKGTGKLWIIDQGKLVFESKEYAQISIDGSKDGNGFTLKYAVEPDYYTQNQQTKYVYQDGEYKVIQNE